MDASQTHRREVRRDGGAEGRHRRAGRWAHDRVAGEAHAREAIAEATAGGWARWNAGGNGTALCSPGFDNGTVLSARCEPGYSANAITRDCERCQATFGGAVALAALLAAALALVAHLLLRAAPWTSVTLLFSQGRMQDGAQARPEPARQEGRQVSHAEEETGRWGLVENHLTPSKRM